MPYTIDEIIADGGALAGLVRKIQDGISGLPVPPEPISAEAYGLLVASVLPELGRLIDDIRENIAD